MLTETRPRREVLWADFDALSADQLLWHASESADDTRAERVRAAVSHALSAKQREVVEAYFFEGLSQGQIAKKLGIRQQVVHKRIFGVERAGRRIGGALSRLREALRNECES